MRQPPTSFDRSIGSAVSNLLVIRNGYDQCRHSGFTPRHGSPARSKHLSNARLGTGEQLHEKLLKISIALAGLITFISTNIDCNLYITVLGTSLPERSKRHLMHSIHEILLVLRNPNNKGQVCCVRTCSRLQVFQPRLKFIKLVLGSNNLPEGSSTPGR